MIDPHAFTCALYVGPSNPAAPCNCGEPFAVETFEEDGGWIAQFKGIDIGAQGSTQDEAVNRLSIALKLEAEECRKRGGGVLSMLRRGAAQ